MSKNSLRKNKVLPCRLPAHRMEENSSIVKVKERKEKWKPDNENQFLVSLLWVWLFTISANVPPFLNNTLGLSNSTNRPPSRTRTLS